MHLLYSKLFRVNLKLESEYFFFFLNKNYNTETAES